MLGNVQVFRQIAVGVGDSLLWFRALDNQSRQRAPLLARATVLRPLKYLGAASGFAEQRPTAISCNDLRTPAKGIGGREFSPNSGHEADNKQYLRPGSFAYPRNIPRRKPPRARPGSRPKTTKPRNHPTPMKFRRNGRRRALSPTADSDGPTERSGSFDSCRWKGSVGCISFSVRQA
jgi:hypothetical protein